MAVLFQNPPRILTGVGCLLDAAAAGACAAFLRSLLKDCGLPKTLSPCGLNGEALPHLAGIAAANRSALLNVRRAGADQVAELYRSCL